MPGILGMFLEEGRKRVFGCLSVKDVEARGLLLHSLIYSAVDLGVVSQAISFARHLYSEAK